MTRAVIGALTFGVISIVFTSTTLILANAPFNLSDFQIGLISIAALVGALGAQFVGKLADRGKAQAATIGGIFLLFFSWIIFLGVYLLGNKWVGLIVFCIGMVVIDLGVQAIHISNQNIILKIDPTARGRINAIYMVFYFLGGAASSLLISAVWGRVSWHYICLLGMVFTLAITVVWLGDKKIEKST